MTEPNRLHVSGTIDARKAVLEWLARRHEYFAEMEQVLVAEGRYTEAQGSHEYALCVLRAYQAEMDDRVPEGL